MNSSDKVVIRHGGRDYVTSAEMARIFEKQVERIAPGDTELVVLRHTEGIEMVLMAGRATFSLRRIGAPAPVSPRVSQRHAG